MTKFSMVLHRTPNNQKFSSLDYSYGSYGVYFIGLDNVATEDSLLHVDCDAGGVNVAILASLIFGGGDGERRVKGVQPPRLLHQYTPILHLRSVAFMLQVNKMGKSIIIHLPNLTDQARHLDFITRLVTTTPREQLSATSQVPHLAAKDHHPAQFHPTSTRTCWKGVVTATPCQKKIDVSSAARIPPSCVFISVIPTFFLLDCSTSVLHIENRLSSERLHEAGGFQDILI
uniref:Uncharacterized protein n=1 Tax=Timema douglasi TaxID=61478 RepID=A0A7R8ZD50_TIMDO|nr:unnamed protein product [Timema douglasi]